MHAGALKDIGKVNKWGDENSQNSGELYRIFFYDCPPLSKSAHKPVSKAGFNFEQTDEAKFRTEFHGELKKLRKVALRPGRISDANLRILKPGKTKELLDGKIEISDLDDSD